MSIIKGTMTKKVGNNTNQLYPKTSADIVLYDDNTTVYDKISTLESGKADASHTHNAATQSAAGFMSAADKTKLDGIESGAEANVQSDWNQSDTTADDYIKNKPTNASASTAGLMSAADKEKLDGLTAMSEIEIETAFDVSHDVDPYKGDSSNRFLRGDKTWVTPNAIRDISISGRTITKTKMDGTTSTVEITTGTTTNTVAAGNHTHATMSAATSSTAGTAGFVPAPTSGKQNCFLRGDATWAVPAGITATILYNNDNGTNVTTSTTSLSGLVSLLGYAYVEIYYSQGTGMGCVKGFINNGITTNALQLITYTYSSNDASLSIQVGTISINDTSITISGGTFKIYRIVGYK